jgi:hypothetical protein
MNVFSPKIVHETNFDQNSDCFAWKTGPNVPSKGFDTRSKYLLDYDLTTKELARNFNWNLYLT